MLEYVGRQGGKGKFNFLHLTTVILCSTYHLLFDYFHNISIDRTDIMKTVDSRNKTKVFQHSLRPSQSLHTRFVRPKLSDSSKDASKRFIE